MCYRRGVSVLPPAHDASTLYVLDISGYIFRAYHALPDLANSRGEPTHAVFGTLNMLRKLLEQQKPAYFAVAMDSKLPSFRHELYDRYKANRPPPPPDLSQQMERVRQLVVAYRIACLQKDGVEADDLIASLVKEARGRNFKVVMVSADKDLLQLVDNNVCMYDSMRERVLGPQEVNAKLGVRPEQVIDYLALTGDSSDNIPGVASVGPKTAVALLTEWGSLDGIYANLDRISRASLKAKLKAHKEDAFLSRRLVELNESIPLDVDWETLAYHGPDQEALTALLGELEFGRPVFQAADARQVPKASLKSITTTSEFQAMCEQLNHAKELVIATAAHVGVPSVLYGIALASRTDGTLSPIAWIPIQPELDSAMGVKDIVQGLAPVLSNPHITKLSADVKHDTMAFASVGMAVNGWGFDAMLASYVLEPERRGHDLPLLAERHLGRSLTDQQAALEPLYQERQPTLDAKSIDLKPIQDMLLERIVAIHELEQLFMKQLAQHKLVELLRELEIPLAKVLADMELTGIELDTSYLATLSMQVRTQLAALEKQCFDLAGQEFNVNAPRKLEAILFDHLGLPVIKRTKTARSTDHDVLEQLALQHPLPATILEYRTLAKLQSTYLEALPKQVNPVTRRIHTCFNQAIAATGRLSSSDPNLQNIPIRNELGRQIRDAFIPRAGWWLLSADYSQIELRILAHLSHDPALLEAFQKEEDVHTLTAQALFQVPAEKVSRQMRGQAKTVNFAVIYGQTDFALSRNLKISRAEAKQYIEAFFTKYAGVRRFMDQVIEEARAHGYVYTLLGRRRHIPDIASTNRNLRMQAERIASNTPIQGSAADVMKLAMLRIHEALHQQRMESRMLLTVHDELVLEVPEPEKAPVATLVKDIMEHATGLSVPLRVEVGYGHTWGQAH